MKLYTKIDVPKNESFITPENAISIGDKNLTGKFVRPDIGTLLLTCDAEHFDITQSTNNNGTCRINRINHLGSSKPKLNSQSLSTEGEKSSASSFGYHGDVDSKNSQGTDLLKTKVYTSRFYILALFAITAFMQYCCWNTFGPISSTCMVIFDWTEAEIAFMASLDPFTYIVTMMLFSWMMDSKGLRVSMIMTTFFMAFGTGIRCITSKTEYVTWSMATGQFFNGLAGPVTQAAPMLLSTNWFPVNERTTATAIASLMGSLGIAMSFIIGPTVVREIDMNRYLQAFPHNGSKRYTDQINVETSPRMLADSTYSEAKYYWPFDNENGFSSNPLMEDENRFDIHSNKQISFQEYKNNHHGTVIGQVIPSRGVFRNGITTIAKKGWINLGDFENECLGKPSMCKQGLSATFWVSFQRNNTKQFLLGTGGLKSRRNGFLVSTKRNAKNTTTFMKIDVIEKSNLWRVYFSTYADMWNHIAITWNRTQGLHAYLNSSLVAHTNISSKLRYMNIRGKSFTVGRVNNAKRYSSASFDEIALWEKTLQLDEVERSYKNSMQGEMSTEEVALRKEKELVKKDVMRLLYVEFGVNAVLFLLILLYFPDKPLTPPTKSSYVERADFSDGVKQLLRSRSFWTLCLIYGITTGVYSGWGSVLNVNLSKFGITQKDAGWLGFYAILVGVGSGMMLARCADLLTGRLKVLILLLFIGASACFLWFSLLCLRIITYSKESLYKAAILGGFFISGTIPLFYELTVEQMYPIAEGVTLGIMTLVNNCVTLLFLIILMIPRLGTAWMNWALCGSLFVFIPVLALFKENYNRLTVDLSVDLSNKDLVQNTDDKEKTKNHDSEMSSQKRSTQCLEQAKCLLQVPDTNYERT